MLNRQFIHGVQAFLELSVNFFHISEAFIFCHKSYLLEMTDQQTDYIEAAMVGSDVDNFDCGKIN